MEYLKRGKLLNDVKEIKPGPVIYWMSRNQRVYDNWALIAAQDLAIKNNVPFYVVFNLTGNFLNAGVRHFGFMLRGLKEVQIELKKLNIPFILLTGNPGDTIPKFIKECGASYLFSDFDSLKIKRLWKSEVLKYVSIPFYDIDAHNVVPCREASPKQEFGAYTIRPKINKVLHNWLEEYPEVKAMPSSNYFNIEIKWNELIKCYDKSVPEVSWIIPGESYAREKLSDFVNGGIYKYAEKRNDPNEDAQSDLSPYLHFGQLSSQTIALEIQRADIPLEIKDSFLEELIVRKELSDNFCFYNSQYDSFEGFPNWGKESLNKHRTDEREFVYSLKVFEDATTHEDLWNAAQVEMVNKGKMHGYMRMYWCKKILEWSASPEDALNIALYLNDKYELDGRDPNGYAGIAWSIGGVHDRAWTERTVYGKIRYMNRNGCARKFDINQYISSNSKINI